MGRWDVGKGIENKKREEKKKTNGRKCYLPLPRASFSRSSGSKIPLGKKYFTCRCQVFLLAVTSNFTPYRQVITPRLTVMVLLEAFDFRKIEHFFLPPLLQYIPLV